MNALNGVRESNVQNTYRRIARLLKQVSSIQCVKLNTSMADNRFGGVILKPSRIGSVDTRITVELERQARSNKNFYTSATPAVSVPLCGYQLCLHLLPTLFFPAKSALIVPTLSTLIILLFNSAQEYSMMIFIFEQLK